MNNKDMDKLREGFCVSGKNASYHDFGIVFLSTITIVYYQFIDNACDD